MEPTLPKALIPAAALLALAAAPAHAEDWRELAITGDAIGFGDAHSLSRKGDEAMVRVMLGLREALGAEANIAFLQSDLRFACASNRYRVEQVRGLDADGAQLAELPGQQGWKAVNEGSLYASFRDFACSAAQAGKIGDPFSATAQFWRPEGKAAESPAIELAGQFYMG